MRYSIFAIVALASAAFAQNCGPAYGNEICAAGKCCTFLPGIMTRFGSNILYRQPVRMGMSISFLRFHVVSNHAEYAKAPKLWTS